MLKSRRGLMALACLLAGAGAFWPQSAGAEHFDITLRVEAPGGQSGEAFMDTTPPLGGVNKRPVVKAKAGQPIRVTWRLKSNFPHGTMKAVTIHFFVVKEAEIGQKPVPDPSGDGGIVDNSFVMDFSPKSKSAGSLRFNAPEAGNYLVRLQSEDTHEEHDHEHFSAIDLKVE